MTARIRRGVTSGGGTVIILLEDDNLEFFISLDDQAATASDLFGHRIRLGKDVPFHRLVTEGGAPAGYLIGWVDGAASSPGGGLTGPRPREPYEEWARRFSGRFVCFLAGDPEREAAFYLDAIGSLGLVYDPDAGEIASSPRLLSRARGVSTPQPREGGHYGFGETALPGALRLMPNFALSAKDLTARRYWPKPGWTPRYGGRAEEAQAEIKRNLHHVLASGSAALHLTAGLDTRMVLAAAWSERRVLPFFTFAPRGRRPGPDIEIARRIARRFDLNHFVISAEPPSPETLDRAVARIGGCARDPSFAVNRIVEVVEGKWRFVSGAAGGEVARAYYWTGVDVGRPAPEARAIMSRMPIIAGPRTQARAEAWLASLPNLPAEMAWDLVALEQRLGHWGGAIGYARRGRHPTVSAFNSIAAVRAILALNPDERHTQRFARDFIAAADPALLRFPVNQWPGLRQVLDGRALIKRILPVPALRQIKAIRGSMLGGARVAPSH
jgi:hypothetical protein